MNIHSNISLCLSHCIWLMSYKFIIIHLIKKFSMPNFKLVTWGHRFAPFSWRQFVLAKDQSKSSLVPSMTCIHTPLKREVWARADCSCQRHSMYTENVNWVQCSIAKRHCVILAKLGFCNTTEHSIAVVYCALYSIYSSNVIDSKLWEQLPQLVSTGIGWNLPYSVSIFG